ncbi:MAG: DnaD domain protein [Bacillota bacterium]|nr:DnaD domain protein [Bacillota bacterium]
MAEKRELTKAFIEQELPMAPPLYVSVYLMTLACGGTAAEVAKKLNATETEVLYAWGYWKGKGYLQDTEKAEKEAKAAEAPKPVQSAAQRPEYSPRELAQVESHPDMQRLFRFASEKLGKALSHEDMSMLYGFHDWLGLPVSVIELLLSYCINNGKRGMRYIEKVAISWAEAGIHTLEQADDYIGMRRNGFGGIMKAFGLNRQPLAAEEEYMKKWLSTYGLSLEVIGNACERTVMRTGRVSFEYADKILTDWKQAGVQSLEDVAALDQAYAARKEQKPAAKKQPEQNKKQNRFINYTQSQWDFEELERLERELREKW